MRTSLAVVLAASVVFAPVALAQPPAEKPAETKPSGDLPTAEALFEKHIAAVGGLEGLKAQKSAMVKARITRPGAPSGLLTVWRKAPDKIYKIIDFPGMVTIETWCDGENAWIRDSNRGASRLSGEALADAKLEAEFIGEADYKGRYKSLKTQEKTTFEGRPAYAVAATPISGADRTIFFDAEKSYLIGERMTLPGPRGKPETLTVAFGDYKQYGSSWQPTSVVEDNGRVKTTTTFTQIEMDVAAMPAEFEVPADVKSAK